MDEKTALHTAARRYCMERIERGDAWYRRVKDPKDLPPEGQHDITLSTVPMGILPEIESVVVDDFATTNDLRAFLLTCARTAPVYVPTAGSTPERDQMISDERERFGSYLATLSPQELQRVPPLPYRRILTEREADRLWWRLERRWGPHRHGFWYPPESVAAPDNTVAFNDEWFALYMPSGLRQILARRGVKRIWQLSTEGPQYEMDLALLFSSYRQTEGYWIADKMEWVLYQSHEHSLTVAGDRRPAPQSDQKSVASVERASLYGVELHAPFRRRETTHQV